MTDAAASGPEIFPSLAALRQAHVDLLQRQRAGPTPAILDEIEELVARGSVTGAVIDADSDRWEAQGVLDYWLAVLFRARRDPAHGTLQPFDPSLAPELADDRCPYRGLEPFREPQHGMFFGRDRVVAEMVARITAGRLLVVVGASGSGKSSLVLAGLIPALKAGWAPAGETGAASERWLYLPPVVPGIHPLDSLASVVVGPDASADARRRQADALTTDPRRLAESLDARGASVLVVVDQFEEVFTLCTDDGERQAFVESLLGVVRSPGPPHRVVLTMRSDFESQVAVFPKLHDVFDSAQYRVPPFNAAELREAIERPAGLIGLRFEEGIVDRLVNEILGEPAGLPLLQFALMKLWERRDRNRITLEAYRSVGGPLKALERSAEDLYGRLLPEEQVTARRILLRIVRPGSSLEVTSSRVLRETVHGGEPRERVDRVLAKLIGAGLLRQTGGPNPAEVQIEVAHEALLRNWPRLVEWLDDERLRLRRRFSVTAAAQQWAAHGKDPGGLLGGSILEEARTFDDLDAIEREFIAASEKWIEREARRKQRVVWVLAVLLVLVVGLAAWVGASALRLQGERNKLDGTVNELKLEQQSVKLAFDQLNRELSEIRAAKAQAEQARASAATVVEAASRAAEAVYESTVDQKRLIAKDLMSTVAAYSRSDRAGVAVDKGPPVEPPAPAPQDPGLPASAPDRRTSLFEGLQIRASAKETGGVAGDSTLPLYDFKISLDGKSDALSRVAAVQYEFDHPTVRNKVHRSEDRRSGFEAGYRGWGCLSSVKVTVTPIGVGVPAETVDFDMCGAVSFRYKK